MTSRLDPSLPTIEVLLRDGRVAHVRPIQPLDKALLEEGLEHMSLASRFARFGFGIDHLTDSELRYLTELDLVQHVAWGALVEGKPVASARYVWSEEDQCAEFAVAVVDDCQRQGLGSTLFRILVASARHNGIECLSFWALPSNTAVMKVMAGIDSHFDERDGLIVGRFRVADVPLDPREPEYVDLLSRYQTGLKDT